VTIEIWHNPRCSKSRQTLKLLHEAGHSPRVVEYLKTPPSEAEIARVLGLLGMEPRQLMRRGEAVYKQLQLADASLGEAELIRAMAANPILIERPVVIAGGKAALGRPPEQVLEIL
jgi:arsenate reductase